MKHAKKSATPPDDISMNHASHAAVVASSFVTAVVVMLDVMGKAACVAS